MTNNLAVPATVRSIGLTDFADITNAPCVAKDSGGYGLIILRFDDSGSPLTPGQITAIYDRCSSRNANEETIRINARTALATNTTFLALPSPNQAQGLAQIQALTRQSNGVIRVLLNQLDGTT
jgi:hypothetical protein